MKVLLFSSDNSDRSGAFLSMCYLANYLRTNHNVDCRVVLPRKGTGDRILEKLNVPYKIICNYDWIIPIDCGSFSKNVIMRIKKYVKYAINYLKMPSLMNYIKEFKPDIIHINTICSFVPAIVAKKMGIHLIWHIREFLEEDWHNKIQFEKYGYSLINKSDRVICISKSVKEKFSSLIDPKKMCVIYNGIHPDKFKGDIKRDEYINILCIGSLVKQKGQSLVIRAAKLLKEKTKINFVIHIVGTGEEYDNLIELAKKQGMDDIVIFEGYQEKTEDFYRKCDFTVVPSFFEPFGRVTVEAMMSGSFVIGSDTAGTKELIGDNQYGRLFRCGDVEDLTNQLLWCFENYDICQKQAQASRKYIAEKFSAENNAANIYGIYRQVV